MTVALVVQVKNENKYLDEWITHYQNLGINHIYIADNNDIDGENLHDVIDKYENYITYIDIRGINVDELQPFIYEYIYNYNNDKYDWWCFFDADEFLEFTKDKSIQEYLSRDVFNNVDQIHINWLIYDDNDLIEYDDRPVQERFTRITKLYDEDTDNNWSKEFNKYACKSIIRKGLNIKSVIHTFVCKDKNNPLVTVDAYGGIANEIWGSSNSKDRYELCYLKHYSTKSLNEFLWKKYDQIASPKIFFYTLDYYFMINRHTKEKDEYIEKYLNLLKLYK